MENLNGENIEKYFSKEKDIEELIFEMENHDELTLIQYELYRNENKNINRIEMVYSIKIEREITEEEREESLDLAYKETIHYPIFVEIDFVNKLLISLSKPHENISFIEDNKMVASSINNLNKKLLFKIIKDFDLAEYNDDERYLYGFTIFNILEKYIATPKIINEKIIEEFEEHRLEDMIYSWFKNSKNLEISSKERFIKELMTLIEKHIATNPKYYRVFMEDVEAYPIKIFKKNDEGSSTDNRSEISLLTKETFYDNKRSLIREKKSEDIILIYKLKNREYKIRFESNDDYFYIKVYDKMGKENFELIKKEVLRGLNNSIN
ncbi:hypothetical protein FYJ27_09820 [Anaerosalibacter bizertensis]|uniref:Uncharacterized protein n=1 Tax=Anaerosalibacter bizertensis TaxID=932217 RepID=A0A844FJ80_9FIRM|nr:hypothetical protein [Anaerosalibacter bizertensis]MSS44020.1 hypothetical protein [Anaerosalibacter bizertensis]